MTDLLELAAREQPNLDQLRQCAEEAADINVCMPATGNTALHLAAAAGSLEACKLLIELGADPLRWALQSLRVSASGMHLPLSCYTQAQPEEQDAGQAAQAGA